MQTIYPNEILIAYYSYSGNTRHIAERIQELTSGSIFEIEPVKAYPTGYNACVAQAKTECTSHFKPELKETVKNINQYKVIFIGTPNWWHTMAPPVLSFIANNNLSGKTIVPFITHGGGGMARCESDIIKACPDSDFSAAIALYGSSLSNNNTTLTNWLNESVNIKR